MFAVYQNKQTPSTRSLYVELSGSFGKTLDRMGKGEREDNNERRRQITFHSFRRFVKTTISDLGMQTIQSISLGIPVQPTGGKRNRKRQRYLRK